MNGTTQPTNPTARARAAIGKLRIMAADDWGMSAEDAKACGEAAGVMEEMLKIIDALPKTADGVPVVLGMTVFVWAGRKGSRRVDEIDVEELSLDGIDPAFYVNENRSDYTFSSESAARESAAAKAGVKP